MSDGASRIAANYKFALSYVFSVRPKVRPGLSALFLASRPVSHQCAFLFRQAPAVIVVEDDFLFSPDFFEYFEHNSRALVRSIEPRLLACDAAASHR